MVTNPVTNEMELFDMLKPYNVAVPLSVQHDIVIKGGAVQYLIIRTDIKINDVPHEKYFVIDSEKYVTRRCNLLIKLDVAKAELAIIKADARFYE